MLGERVEEKTTWYIAMCQLELLVILFLNEENDVFAPAMTHAPT